MREREKKKEWVVRDTSDLLLSYASPYRVLDVSTIPTISKKTPIRE
jgi:hypothetical protein